MSTFPSYRQLDHKDCGPACLKIILKHYGKDVSLQSISELCEISRSGTTFLGLSRASEKLGLKSFGLNLTFDSLSKEMQLPCIVHWKQKHFIVVYRVTNKAVFVSDPSHGLIQYPTNEFLNGWQLEKQAAKGLALFFEPMGGFHPEPSQEEKKVSLFFLWKYLVRYKQLLLQLCYSVLAVTAIQLAFPFLTQALVDQGIQNQNFNFVFLQHNSCSFSAELPWKSSEVGY